MRASILCGFTLAVSLCGACSSDDGSVDPNTSDVSGCQAGTATACACQNGASGTQTCLDGQSYSACDCGTEQMPSAPSGGGTNGPAPGNGSAGSTSMPPPTMEPEPVPTDPGPTPMDPPSVPVNPDGPAVEIPGLACDGVLDGDLASPNVQIGGRRVYVDYACNQPQGTPVTFILNLHGTMAQESGRHYIRGYFPAFKHMGTHGFVIATPISVVSQWGNGDGGVDEPHLMEVVDWVYANFAGFDIQQMWVVGHSWGAMYARSFACKPELADKVHGVVLMSGGSGMPACADRLAALGTVGETDIVAGELSQAAAAGGHGCAAQMTSQPGNNVITEWPGCDAGWVHKNYLMLGKGHGFSPVDWPDEGMVLDMADAIRSTR